MMYDQLHRLLNLPYRLHFTQHGDWSDISQPVLVLIHGIGVNQKIWDELISELGSRPILAVDLLGFGDSRAPEWPDYSLRDHARSLRRTIQREAWDRDLILCGHSLGTLVAIEYAKRYPGRTKRLILCSPPIYIPEDFKKRSLREALLKTIGKSFLKALKTTPQILKLVNQYSFIQENFEVTPKKLSSYSKTARNSILLQNSLQDAIKLPEKLPINMIYGTLDPVIIPANLKKIAKLPNATISTVLAGHEMGKRYNRALIKLINSPSETTK